jgi:hypothetical protein
LQGSEHEGILEQDLWAFYKRFEHLPGVEYAQSAITFIVTGALTFLAAKWLSANHLCCVQAAQRPQGLGLDTYKLKTLVYAVQGDSFGLHRMDDMQRILPRSGVHPCF